MRRDETAATTNDNHKPQSQSQPFAVQPPPHETSTRPKTAGPTAPDQTLLAHLSTQQPCRPACLFARLCAWHLSSKQHQPYHVVPPPPQLPPPALGPDLTDIPLPARPAKIIAMVQGPARRAGFRQFKFPSTQAGWQARQAHRGQSKTQSPGSASPSQSQAAGEAPKLWGHCVAS